MLDTTKVMNPAEATALNTAMSENAPVAKAA
jgi:hypothetical protein